MIVTGKQATKAIKQVVRKTRWTLRRISRETGVSHTTIWRIFNGEIDNPALETLNSIDELVDAVDAL